MAFPPEAPVQVEVPILSLRRHGRYLVLPALLLLAVAAAAGFWVGALPEPWMNWAAGAGGALAAILVGLGPILGWMATRTTITNRRVIQRHGLLVHHRSEVPLSRVRSVHLRRGPVQRMFRSGDIELLIGTEPAAVLRDVPGCVAVVDALQELIEHNFALGATGSTGGHIGSASQGAPAGPGAGGGFAAPTHRPGNDATTMFRGL
ncbi:hypothetical protein LEUCIP111803_02246 [Leucobacter soli]|uniref:YdbS-like PH domain-containing protein n=2 Tax=Leucobacter soli TaxID=2812850 RepID=A0A916NPC5_9MICO|nr:PH domain-containing protein [Leucobacter soli]CAG7618909.1 hypothetical protein LEUCIP111803_02246 [Leucobacter soli]